MKTANSKEGRESDLQSILYVRVQFSTTKKFQGIQTGNCSIFKGENKSTKTVPEKYQVVAFLKIKTSEQLS